MTLTTVMMVLHMVGIFFQQHWHKVIAVIAFFFAAYNKWQHNALFNKLSELTNTDKQKNKKSKKHKSNKKK